MLTSASRSVISTEVGERINRVRHAWLLATLLVSGCGDHPPSATPTRHQEHVESTSALVLPDEEPVVRVRLERVDDERRSLQLGSKNQQLTLSWGTVTHQVTGPIKVSRTAAGWALQGVGNRKKPPPSAEPIRVWSDGPVLLHSEKASRRYSGVLHCIPLESDGDPMWDLVEHIKIESYLPGVLVGELYAGWEPACYQAQCIAARSFACMEVQLNTSRHYDVVDGPVSQAYHGDVDDQAAIDATSSTSGMVLAWDEGLVPGYYSSC